MDPFCSIISGMMIISGVLLAAGLYRPWWVLWWMSYQNRLRVISLYLPVLLVLALLRLVIC